MERPAVKDQRSSLQLNWRVCPGLRDVVGRMNEPNELAVSITNTALTIGAAFRARAIAFGPESSEQKSAFRGRFPDYTV